MIQSIRNRLDTSRQGIEVKTNLKLVDDIASLCILDFLITDNYTICCDKNGLTYNLYFIEETTATLFILKYGDIVV